MEIPFTAPAYDAFVTDFEDHGAGPRQPFALDVFVNAGPGSGTVVRMDDEGHPPDPELGRHLARLFEEIPEIDRALFVVLGVPIPGWAVAVFEQFRDARPIRLRAVDLLGVSGYRWESYRLSRAVA